MKPWVIVIGLCFMLLVACSQTEIQPSATPILEATLTKGPESQIIVPDLKALPEGTGWSGSTQAATLVEKDGAPAVEFDEPDWNLVWMDGFEFNDGTIEFDAKGKSEPPQGSFIGVMFRAVDEATYDAVYFRPFNFRASDETRKSHAVQYVSSPEWSWERLRAEKTGQYEKPIEPAPDGDLWFHAKITIEGREIRVFVNNAEKPALQVTELSDRSGGSVGIWCYGYGVISNLQIIPVR
jgi:hypothetical protein